jgi:hypothetical protein
MVRYGQQLALHKGNKRLLGFVKFSGFSFKF